MYQLTSKKKGTKATRRKQMIEEGEPDEDASIEGADPTKEISIEGVGYDNDDDASEWDGDP
jgi:hypothetical protein